MEYIKFDINDCKDCYACLRNCPVKAIKFINNKATILSDSCILCGQCVNVCPQDAKHVNENIKDVYNLIDANPSKVALSVAPSFITNFNVTSFDSFANACKKLGFEIVEETAIGAAMVTSEYEKIFKENPNSTFISTACPAAVDYVRTNFPNAIKYLLPVVSPMIAHARKIKEKYGNDYKVVFVGPCIAKKKEADLSNEIDVVITFEELNKMLKSQHIEFEEVNEHEDYELQAKFYPINRGIIKSFINKETTQDYISIDGGDEIDDILQNIDGFENTFIEMNMCKGGCINGPAKISKANVMKDNIAIKKYARKKGKEVDVSYDFSLSKHFTPLPKNYVIPTDEEIKSILVKLNKFSKEDEINCGACGYKSCKEKAIAIYNGLADPEFCLPFLKNKAESISNEIISHTPNGIITVNKKGIIIDINDRALDYLTIDKSVIGSFYQEHILLPELFDCIEKKQNLASIIVYNDKNDKYFDVSITIVKEHDYAFAIYKDVTHEIIAEEKMKKLRKEMIDVTNEVINKQMRAVQEIASLLGESTAEAKIALVNFKDSLKDE